jgi:hypothetical protein
MAGENLMIDPIGVALAEEFAASGNRKDRRYTTPPKKVKPEFYRIAPVGSRHYSQYDGTFRTSIQEDI